MPDTSSLVQSLVQRLANWEIGWVGRSGYRFSKQCCGDKIIPSLSLLYWCCGSCILILAISFFCGTVTLEIFPIQTMCLSSNLGTKCIDLCMFEVVLYCCQYLAPGYCPVPHVPSFLFQSLAQSTCHPVFHCHIAQCTFLTGHHVSLLPAISSSNVTQTSSLSTLPPIGRQHDLKYIYIYIYTLIYIMYICI